MARVLLALLMMAFLVGCSTKYVIPPRNTTGHDYRLEVTGTKGNQQAGLRIACWRRTVMIGDSTVEYRRRLSVAGWFSTIAAGVALAGGGTLGWSHGWTSLGQYSIGLGVLVPVAAAILAPKHGIEKAPSSLLKFKPAAGEEVTVQNLTRSASVSCTTNAGGVATVPLGNIRDWFSGKEEVGIWIAPRAAGDKLIAAKVTSTGNIAKVRAEDLGIEMAETENTVEAYKDFVNEFPSSKYAVQARESTEALSWRSACLADTKEAYQEFVTEFPHSESVSAVPRHVEILDWTKACQTNTRESYQEFKDMHPECESIAAIPGHIERVDWDSANSANTAESYQAYLRTYASGLFVAEAKQGIEKLKQARQDSVNQAEETRRERLEAEREAAEKRRREAEQYRLRSNEEAIQEWKRFRKNEEAEAGTATTWRFKISDIRGGNLFGYLDEEYDYSVVVEGSGDNDYLSEVIFRSLNRDPSEQPLPVVKENDWIVVTGILDRISMDGSVVLTAVRVKNEGYRE